jgi:hypothetical protein
MDWFVLGTQNLEGEDTSTLPSIAKVSAIHLHIALDKN